MAAIATTVFSKEAKNSANIMRMPDFQTVEITHPLSTLTPEQIKQRAYEAVQFIVPILTGKAAEIRYEGEETRTSSILLNTKEPAQDVASCADE